MAIRESPKQLGDRRARGLRTRISEELATARRVAGLSLREVARRLGTSHHRIAAIERARSASMTWELVAGFAAVVGLELAASLHPAGAPVRDKGQLGLLDRLRRRLGDAIRWRTEVVMPVPGTLRSADAVIDGPGFDAVIEAETHLHDIQLVERHLAAKQRDLGTRRAILLVSDTRHNRAVIAATPELSRRFPVSTRACLAALARGRDPGGDCLVIL